MYPNGVIIVEVEIVVAEKATIISAVVNCWYEDFLQSIISNVVIITNKEELFILKLAINMNFVVNESYFDK